MFNPGWEVDELRWQLKVQRKHEATFLAQLADVGGVWRERGASRPVRRLVAQFLQSRHMQHLALYHRFRVKRGESKLATFAARFSDVLDAPPSSLQPQHPITEPIHVRRRSKSRGGFRYTFSFGHHTSSRHELMRRCMAALCDGHFRYQGMYIAAHRRHLVQRICAIVTDEAPTHVAVLDISDFFGSISHDFLRDWLPFPTAVTENSLLAPMTLIGGITTDDRQSRDTATRIMQVREPRRGIPQGASCSSIIAYAALETIVRAATPSLPLLQYGDDVLILGRDVEEITDQVSRLEQCLREHSAGPLTLGRRSITQLVEGFEFMQLRFAPTAPSWDAQRCIAVTITANARSRFLANVNERIIACVKHRDFQLFGAEDYIAAWLKQAACDDADSVAAQGYSYLNSRAQALGLV